MPLPSSEDELPGVDDGFGAADGLLAQVEVLEGDEHRPHLGRLAALLVVHELAGEGGAEHRAKRATPQKHGRAGAIQVEQRVHPRLEPLEVDARFVERVQGGGSRPVAQVRPRQRHPASERDRTGEGQCAVGVDVVVESCGRLEVVARDVRDQLSRHVLAEEVRGARPNPARCDVGRQRGDGDIRVFLLAELAGPQRLQPVAQGGAGRGGAVERGEQPRRLLRVVAGRLDQDEVVAKREEPVGVPILARHNRDQLHLRHLRLRHLDIKGIHPRVPVEAVPCDARRLARAARRLPRRLDAQPAGR
eukprot:818091-Prymnesium_polylepis.2